MRREKPAKGIYSNRHEGPDLDCSVCTHRKEGCRQAAEGKFCARFRSKAFDPQGQDPNDLWRRGEEVEFDE